MKYEKFNVDSFINDLSNLPWSNLDCLLNVNDRWDLWKKIFMTAVDKHAPFKSKQSLDDS